MDRKMVTVVVSDLHMGSKYFFCEKFSQFLSRLPDGSTLVLNGDTIDHPFKRLPKDHQEILDRLIERSRNFPVIWLPGNHDHRFQLENPGNIIFKTHHAVDHRIYMAHGNIFDHVMPKHRWFIFLFHLLHDFRIKLGAQSVHVAYYAKKYKRLYNYLRKNVIRKSVTFAKQNGFEIVTCGHTHYAEDMQIDGVRYINTGTWTENASFCLVIDGSRMKLMNSEMFCEKDTLAMI